VVGKPRKGNRHNDYGTKKARKNQRKINLELNMEEILSTAKGGLLALAVNTGLHVFQAMMQEDVTRLAGPKGKHNPHRQAVRHGKEKGSVVLGGQKVSVEKPRVRSMEGEELHLEAYEIFQDSTLLTEAVLERMIHGLSTRNYTHGLEPTGVDESATAISKSTLSRRFIERTEKALAEIMSRSLKGKRYLALFLDAVHMADHAVVVAMGVDEGGNKEILGLWEGATENATVCKALLSDLVDRGLKTDEGIMIGIDGSKALRAAIRDVFGPMAVVQRCQVHKMRNVMDHLPEPEQHRVQQAIRTAWRHPEANKALDQLKGLASQLEQAYPGAAASLREGMEETLTVVRLGLPEQLQTTLRSTNAIESAFKCVRESSRNVKRWQHGNQVLRWTAAGLLEAETRFHRIKGYRHLSVLKEALAQYIKLEKRPITA
jgi:putative transposase